jgi:hypothetical protein
MSARELLIEAWLAGQQPVHCLVEFGLVGGLHVQQLTEAGVEGVGPQGARGGELGSGIEEASDDYGDGEVALTAGFGIEEGVELEFAEETEGGGDVAVGQGADDAKGVGQGSISGGGAAFEDLAEGFDLVRGPVGDIGEGYGI